MNRITLKSNCALALVVAGLLASGQVIADKPSWAGGGKGEKSEQKGKSAHSKGGQRDVGGPAVKMHEHFGDRHRTAVNDYYSDEFRRGKCPPGLAKKHNGCMPPGQAKKWTVGRPLPREVIYYDVPPALVAQFGQPPAGHRYVRVLNDILLIALGKGTVVDAIQNLGRV